MTGPEMPEQVLAEEGAEEVDFPWWDAGHAVHQLTTTADVLAEQLETRPGMIDSIVDWAGGFRDEFDEVYVGLESTASGPGGLVERLRTLAGLIVDGAQEANDEQIRLNGEAEEAVAAA